MKIKDLLKSQDDKWVSIVGNTPPTIHDTEDDAGKATEEKLKVLGTPDLKCTVKQLACFQLVLPEMLILIEPDLKDSDLQLGRTILQELGKFAGKVSVTMKGKPAPVVEKAKTKPVQPKPAGPKSSVEWGGRYKKGERA